MSLHQPAYGTVDWGYARQLATIDPADDGPVWMVNLMAYKDIATYSDADDPEGRWVGSTGREADDRYAPLAVLADLGAEVVFFGDVTDQLLGDAPRWDRVAVVRYPTRRSFMEMQSRPDFQALHVHKEAGMASTVILAALPIEPPPWPEGVEPSRPWTEVPFPPTETDGPVMVVHVIRYADEAGRTTMEGYQSKAAVIAGRHGVQVGGWFDVEGVPVGDGRPWDQVRFNRFPSRGAFMEVVFDPERLEAQHAYREPAMADTYTLIVRPLIDRLDR